MDEIEPKLKVPQLDVDNTEYKDVTYDENTIWRAQSNLLSMNSGLFAELNFSGYIIINKSDFSVKFTKQAIRRIIRFSFTKGSLDNEFGNDFMLERVKDALSYGYVQLPDSEKQHVGFMNVLYGEVFDEEGDIDDIGLTMNLVLAGYDNKEDRDASLFNITATLLGAVSALLESIQNDVDSK